MAQHLTVTNENGTADPSALMDNLGSLSDDEFFRRLSALRAEHKKTLMHYEQLYHEKLISETGGDIGLVFGEPLFSGQKKEKPERSGLLVTGRSVDLSARPPSPSNRSARSPTPTKPTQSTTSPTHAAQSSTRKPEPTSQLSPQPASDLTKPESCISPTPADSPIHTSIKQSYIDATVLDRGPFTTTRLSPELIQSSSPPQEQEPAFNATYTQSRYTTEENGDYDIELIDTEQESPSIGRDYEISLQEPVNTGGDTFNQSLEFIQRSSEKPPAAPRSPVHVQKPKQAWFDYSSTDPDLNPEDDNDYVSQRYKSQDVAMSQITAMWDDFNIADYSKPVARQPPEGQKTRKSLTKSKENWRNRITMPEPFEMTKREDAKVPQKSRTLLEYEHKQAMKDMEERFECDKKFRAQPVPAHVYLPLYEEIMEKAATRRRNNVEEAKEFLKSQDKPFQFNERQKKIPDHSRHHSAPMVQKRKTFKAKPIPKSVKADVSERLLEEEEYRKIRIRMRSKELLRTSSLPPRMATREECTVGRLKQKLSEKEKSTSMKAKRRPVTSQTQKKRSKSSYKDPCVATVCEPFNFRSTTIPSNIDKVLADIEKDERELRENRWPYKNLRAKPKLGEVRRSWDTLPFQSTTANDLRNTKNSEYLKEKSQKELQDQKNKERQQEIMRRRKKELAEKACANDRSVSLKASQEEKLRKFREEERQRIQVYRRELEEMENRVNQQPFLFERQSQINARKQADKRFEEALRSAGVTEGSISSYTRDGQSTRSRSIASVASADPMIQVGNVENVQDDEYTYTFEDDNEDLSAEEIAEEIAA